MRVGMGMARNMRGGADYVDVETEKGSVLVRVLGRVLMEGCRRGRSGKCRHAIGN